MASLSDWLVTALVLACTYFEMRLNGRGNAGRGPLLWDWLYWLAALCLDAALIVFASAFHSCAQTCRLVATPGAAGKDVAVLRSAVQALVLWRLLAALGLTRALAAALWLAWRAASAVAAEAASLVWRRPV